MPKKKPIGLLLAIALMLGGIHGCGTKIETKVLKPHCNLPNIPREKDLPDVDADAVYDALEAYHGEKKGRAIAEALRARERLLIDSLLEHRAILDRVCGPAITSVDQSPEE